MKEAASPLGSIFVGESLIIKLSSVFIFDDPLALLELRLTAAIQRGGLNDEVLGDTPELLIGCRGGCS